MPEAWSVLLVCAAAVFALAVARIRTTDATAPNRSPDTRRLKQQRGRLAALRERARRENGDDAVRAQIAGDLEATAARPAGVAPERSAAVGDWNATRA